MADIQFDSRLSAEVSRFVKKTSQSRRFQNILDELLCSICYSLQMQTMSIIYFNPIIFSNKVIQAFLLRNFKGTKDLLSKIQIGHDWKYKALSIKGLGI